MAYQPFDPRRRKKYRQSGPIYKEDLWLGGGPVGGGFSPSDISGLTVWLKSDSLVANDNDPIEIWGDDSGNGNNVTQVTEANKPLFKINIINGKPVLRFDGANDGLEKTSFGPLAQPTTIFYVAKFFESGTNDHIIDGTTGRQTVYKQSTDKLSFFAGTEVPEAVAESIPTAFFYVSAIFNGASSEMFKNSISIASGNVGAASLEGTFTVGRSDSGGGFANVDIAEIIIYNSALSVANRQLVEGYLADKYGL